MASYPSPSDPERRGTDEKAIDRVEHSQRLHVIQALKPRERQALYLKGMGYSYQEIAEATGSTFTAVNRWLTEGRARLRRHARERNQDPGDARDKEDGEGARFDGDDLHGT